MEDSREVYLERREVAYTKDQNDYDERERYNKFAGERTVTVYRKFDSDEYDNHRNGDTSAQGEYDRVKSEYGRDYDRYYDNRDRNRDLRDQHSTKTNSSYDRPRTDSKGDNRGSSYVKGHSTGSNHSYGKSAEASGSHNYVKGHESGRGYDRNKNNTKKDFGNFKPSSKRDTYKTRDDSDKSKPGNNRKDIPKGRSTDDLWRNAGYGKTMSTNRDHVGPSGDRGLTAGNYPGSNTQSTWSQRGRNSSSHAREGTQNFQQCFKIILIKESLDHLCIYCKIIKSPVFRWRLPADSNCPCHESGHQCLHGVEQWHKLWCTECLYPSDPDDCVVWQQ